MADLADAQDMRTPHGVALEPLRADGPLPPEIPYPAAPWRMRGQFWIGVFKADTPAALPSAPARLAQFLDPHLRVVALMRYLEGTLRYDELLIGSLARVGWQVGMYIDYLYVDSVASLWGGRRIWGLPKELASFTWAGNACRIADERGPIVSLTLNRRDAWAPPLPLTSRGIGRVDGHWAFIATPLWARLGVAEMRLRDWSPRFSYRLPERPRLAFAGKPVVVTFPPPRLVYEI